MEKPEERHHQKDTSGSKSDISPAAKPEPV